MAGHSREPFACDADGYVYDRTGNCLASCETPDLPAHEWRANSALFAAAPDLLDLCDRLLRACATDPALRRGLGYYRFEEELKAAVARAGAAAAPRR